MKSLLLLVLLAVLSVRNDAAEIKNMNNLILPKDTSLADPSSDIPATIDSSIDVEEFLEILGDDQEYLDLDLVDTRANLGVGSIGSADRQLYRSYFSRAGIANTVRTLTVTYRGASSIRISMVRAREQGTSQNAKASITAGGLGRNTVSVKLTSARGRGFHYLVEIYGR